MRSILVCSLALALASPASAAPRAKRPAPAGPSKAARKAADAHFKTGVGLFERGRYADALAAFERAYALAPHPIVLYNIAGCHRELLHYRAAVAAYQRFLAEGAGKVPAERLDAARTELDALYARTAKVTVTLPTTLGDAELTLDGERIDTADMPLLLAPGEHRLTVRADGKRDADKIVRVAPGDELSVAMEPEAPPPVVVDPSPPATATDARDPLPIIRPPSPRPRRFVVSAGAGTNLARAAHADNGAPMVGLGVALGRLELAADVTLVAFAVVPMVRVRVLGELLSLHVVGALPIAFNDGDMTETFIAGGGGLGVRYRPLRSLSVSVESYAAFASKGHGTTIPTFLRGEVWF